MAIKFMTAKGSEKLTSKPYYIGHPQHERVMGKKEAYEFFAERTGYKPAAIRAGFLALREFVRENAAKGNITFIDGVASVRHYVKGSFESLSGPWTKGRNYIALAAVEVEPFKSLLANVIPTNNTEGAKPMINTIFDEVTREYGFITGTDTFSVAGAELGPDETKDDEYVAIVDDKGQETRAVVSYSDLQNVKAAFTSAPAAGEYTLVVYTRSGMGDSYGVSKATRKVTVK